MKCFRVYQAPPLTMGPGQFRPLLSTLLIGKVGIMTLPTLLLMRIKWVPGKSPRAAQDSLSLYWWLHWWWYTLVQSLEVELRQWVSLCQQFSSNLQTNFLENVLFMSSFMSSKKLTLKGSPAQGCSKCHSCLGFRLGSMNRKSMLFPTYLLGVVVFFFNIVVKEM